jgi:hypothetical protein
MAQRRPATFAIDADDRVLVRRGLSGVPVSPDLGSYFAAAAVTHSFNRSFLLPVPAFEAEASPRIQSPPRRIVFETERRSGRKGESTIT